MDAGKDTAQAVTSTASKGLSTGAKIAAIVVPIVGGLLLLLGLLLCCCCCLKKRKAKKAKKLKETEVLPTHHKTTHTTDMKHVEHDTHRCVCLVCCS